jgi:hypothetical protein
MSTAGDVILLVKCNTGKVRPVTKDEIEAIKKELAEALAEIENLKLRLNNVTLLLKSEMTRSGSLPKPKRQ